VTSGPIKAVILQPSYIPWRGVFHQIQKADIFVFYDDVQYDKRGWRNRNRIKTPSGNRWLTIPVRSRGAQVERTTIREIQICWDRPWPQKHLEAIRHSYSKAPFFERYAPILEVCFAERHQQLADLTIDLTVRLAGELGLVGKRFLRSSTLPASGAKDDRLISLMKALDAHHYISGPSARAYIDEAKVNDVGITVEYMTYDYPPYEQLHPPFDPHVSIFDLLFMKGPEAPRFIWPSEPPWRGPEEPHVD
jgi:hypothetical protein